MADNIRPTAKPVVSGKTSSRKKSFGRRVFEAFVSDEVDNIGEYMIFDVLIPAIGNGLCDSLTSGIEMFFKGKGYRSKSSGSSIRISGGGTNYNGISSNKKQAIQQSSKADRFGVNDIWFEERIDAEKVLREMKENLEAYDNVRVSDLYSAAGITADWARQAVNDRYGWDTLKDTFIKRDSGGYVIIFPDPIILE